MPLKQKAFDPVLGQAFLELQSFSVSGSFGRYGSSEKGTGGQDAESLHLVQRHI